MTPVDRWGVRGGHRYLENGVSGVSVPSTDESRPGRSPITPLVGDHFAVIGQAAGGDEPYLAAQLGDRL